MLTLIHNFTRVNDLRITGLGHERKIDEPLWKVETGLFPKENGHVDRHR